MDNRQRNLGFFFDATVRRVPDKVAIIDLFGGGERCSTYRQLDARMDGWPACSRGSACAPASAWPCWSATAPSLSNFSSGPCAPARSRCRSIPGLPPTRSRTSSRMRHAWWRWSIPPATAMRSRSRERVAAAAAVAARSGGERLSGLRGGNGASPPPRSSRRPSRTIRRPSSPIRPGSTGRPKGAIMTHRGMLWYVAYNQRYWPSCRERPRARCAAAVSQECAARHGEADALCRRLLRADARLRAARLSRGAGQVQVHLFARRRCGVHDVSAASRLFADARPQRAARHDHRLGGGDA